MPFDFSTAPRIVFGRGRFEEIGRIAAGLGRSALVVTNAGADGEQKVIAIRVKSYESDDLDLETLQPIIAKIEAKLENEDWEQIVRVREGDERTTVSVKYDEKDVLGLFVMAIEPGDEVAFVNIVGRFNLNDLDNFDIDLDDAALDSLREKFSEEEDD